MGAMIVLLGSTALAGTVDCGTTDPCCPNTCYERRGEVTPDPGPLKTDKQPTLGKKSPIAMYAGETAISGLGMCAEYTTGVEVILSAVGGEDVDVCYRPAAPPEVPSASWNGYGVPSNVVWSGAPGYQDANSSSVFHLRPTGPGQYTVTVTSEEGSGPCNVGSESVSTSTLVSFWRISNITPETTVVVRGKSQPWAIELQNCDPVAKSPLWRSNVTTATGEGLSWGGEHCIDYRLTCETTATCRCPGHHIITATRAKDVVTTKGRTFNCTVANDPQRYPVGWDYQGSEELRTDCTRQRTKLGLTWDYPYTPGRYVPHAESIAQRIAVKRIDSGPNAFLCYIDNMNQCRLDIDTNTAVVFTATTTTWYMNHETTEIPELHGEAQAHEGRHYANVAKAEALMDDQSTHPQDMFDACEDMVGPSEEAVRANAAGMIADGIHWVDRISIGFDQQQHVDGLAPGEDYYRLLCNPARGCCYPGVPCCDGCP